MPVQWLKTVEQYLARHRVAVPEAVRDLAADLADACAERGVGPVGAGQRVRGALAAGMLGTTGCRLGTGVVLTGRSRIHLGRGVRLGDYAVVAAGGKDGFVRIGDDSHVDAHCVLYGEGGLTIGRGCAIASHVCIYTQTNQVDADPRAAVLAQPVRYAPVHIGDHVWIGAGAMVLPGVHIGDHAVVGAGALVRSDVPAWNVVVGVPARVLRSRLDGAPEDAAR